MRLITVLSFAITITVISFPYKMLQFWISEDVAIHATQALIILSWTNLFLALAGPLTNFLVGLGKLRALTQASVSAAILNALLLLYLVPYAGFYGAAWAYLLSLTPYLFLFSWTEGTLLRLQGRLQFYARFLCKLGITSIFVFLINTTFLASHIHNIFEVIIYSAISIFTFFILYYVLGFFEAEDKRDLSTFVKIFLNSLQVRKRRA